MPVKTSLPLGLRQKDSEDGRSQKVIMGTEGLFKLDVQTGIKPNWRRSAMYLSRSLAGTSRRRTSSCRVAGLLADFRKVERVNC